MSQPSAEVHLTKIAAAQRQLGAAIRMFFAEDDDPSVRRIASTAFRAISEMQSERLVKAAANHYMKSVFNSVRDYRRGKLPEYPGDVPWVAGMAKLLPIGPDTSFDQYLKALGNTDLAKALRRKHKLAQSHRPKVDRGADASIPASEFDTFALLLQSLAAYTDLVKRDVGPEGVVLSLFDRGLNDDVQRLPEELRPMGLRLMQLPPEERRAFCALLIDELDATTR